MIIGHFSVENYNFYFHANYHLKIKFPNPLIFPGLPNFAGQWEHCQ